MDSDMPDSGPQEVKIQFTSNNASGDARWLLDGKDALDVVGSELRDDGAEVELHDSASGAPGDGSRAVGIDTVVVGIAVNLVSDLLFRLASEIVARLRKERDARRGASQVELKSGNVAFTVTPDDSSDSLKRGISVLARSLVETGSLEVNKLDPK
jgi:hypothetical protein